MGVVDESVTGGVWVSSDLAASLGAEPGGVIETSAGVVVTREKHLFRYFKDR